MAGLFRHFVAMESVVRLPDGSDRGLVRSGFLVAIRGLWLWVTAGHCISELREMVEQGGSIRTSRFVDTLHHPSSQGSVALPIAELPWFHIDEEELGIDCGAILIPKHFARLIAVAGCVPLTLRSMATQNQMFDGYIMLGLPDAQQQVALSAAAGKRQALFQLAATMLPLTPVETPQGWGKSEPRLHFRVVPNQSVVRGQVVEIESVLGMSGGPVFGLERSGSQINYRLLGVQSRQGETTRITSVCPVRKFVRAVAVKVHSRASAT